MGKRYLMKKVLIVFLAALLTGWIGKTALTVPEESSKLGAVKVDTDIRIDGDAIEIAWEKATEYEISLGSIKVGLKAVYTVMDLFILASWNDPTFSIVRGGSWVWDKNAWNNKREGQSEDRIAFFWPIDIPTFESKGCLVKCHPGYGGSGAFLDTPEQSGDMWHMKAARSLGVISQSQSGSPVIGDDHQATAGTFTLIGYTDDEHVTYEDPANLPDDGGTHGDSGTSTYSHNRNQTKTAPLYMEKNPTDYLDAMILKKGEIEKGETVEVMSATAEEISKYWGSYQRLGAVVPERILREPSDSRADIRQAGTWSNGRWTVEMKRALETGNDDDIQFSYLSLDYLFGLSIMDNAGGEAHTFSEVNILHFLPVPIETEDPNCVMICHPGEPHP